MVPGGHGDQLAERNYNARIPCTVNISPPPMVEYMGMSFLKIGDRAAGAIKSGGTTRRAAKMVVVDIDHPDIEEFISWKTVEEQKVAALVAGSKLCSQHLNGIILLLLGPHHSKYCTSLR